MRHNIRSLSVALLLVSSVPALTVAGTAASVPLADDPERIADVAVTYQDLDLRKEADARVMLKRLERAAVTACGGNPQWHPAYGIMPRRTAEVFAECRRDAVARAVAKLNTPTLSHVFASVYGQEPVAAQRS